MTICAEWLHMPLGAFRALPEDEQRRWQLYAQERWRRETVQATEQRNRAEEARQQARMERRAGQVMR